MTDKNSQSKMMTPGRLVRAQQLLERTGDDHQADKPVVSVTQQKPPAEPAKDNKKVEIGGPDGPDPTRFGDWERNGRCIDF